MKPALGALRQLLRVFGQAEAGPRHHRRITSNASHHFGQATGHAVDRLGHLGQFTGAPRPDFGREVTRSKLGHRTLQHAQHSERVPEVDGRKVDDARHRFQPDSELQQPLLLQPPRSLTKNGLQTVGGLGAHRSGGREGFIGKLCVGARACQRFGKPGGRRFPRACQRGDDHFGRGRGLRQQAHLGHDLGVVGRPHLALVQLCRAAPAQLADGLGPYHQRLDGQVH